MPTSRTSRSTSSSSSDVAARPDAENSARRAALQRRTLLAFGITFGAYAASVATHLGEFWPFSIFPMFSGAGKPWTRALLIDVTGNTPDWGPWSLDNLPGRVLSTRSLDVSTNDLSKFIQLTKTWDDQTYQALKKLCAAPLEDGKTLSLLRCRGRLLDEGQAEITVTPLVRFDRQSMVVNPTLEQSA